MSVEKINGYGPALHLEEVNDLLQSQKSHEGVNGQFNGAGSDDVTQLPVCKEETSRKEGNLIGWAILDHVICGLIVAPLVIAFWWAIWDLMDLLIFPDNYDLSLWFCIAIGCVFNGFAYCLQEWTLRRAEKATMLESVILHRLYACLFGIMTISLWRGMWEVWDHYSGINAISVIVSLCVSCVTLIPLRAFRAGKSPPLVLCNDLEFEGFHCTTRFSRQYKDGKVLYILDNLFTAWVIHPLYVTLWRGVWTAMDLIIYPEDMTKSIWVTLVFGYSLTIFCYILQIPSYHLYNLITHKKGSVLWKILVDDVIHILVHVATIAVWRGWWELYLHFIPGEGETLRLWISSAVSIFLLMLMMTSNSVIGHGCEVDGEEDPAPFYYIRYTRYLMEHMEKKMEANEHDSKSHCNGINEKSTELQNIETFPNRNHLVCYETSC